MKIDNPTGDPDCHKPQYAVRFEERQVEDLRFEYPREAFERVREASGINESVYATFVSPWVQAAVNPWVAESLKWLHPMRTSRYLFSDAFNPWMRAVATLAEAVGENRRPLPDDHPLIEQERAFVARVSDAIKTVREGRDSASERLFDLIYATPLRPNGGRAGESLSSKAAN